MNSEIIMYQTEDGLTKIETTFDKDTVWLSIDQMAELFQRDKSTISRHIKNIFSEGELVRDSVVVNFATTAAEIQAAKRHKTEVKLTILGTVRCSRKNVLDLVAVIGNVMDNALEAVKGLEPSQRKVTWSIRKDPVDYIFEFSNPLLLSNQTTKRDFIEEGFSTKGGDRGHGLSITRRLTEKMEGTIKNQCLGYPKYKTKK